MITMPVFSSTMRISPERPTTMVLTVPSVPLWSMVRNSSNSIRPATFALMSELSAMFEAVPPTWNVRSVSCVPGSPMDCAAITPTASPICAGLCEARLRP